MVTVRLMLRPLVRVVVRTTVCLSVVSSTAVKLPGAVFCRICVLSLTLTHLKRLKGVLFIGLFVTALLDLAYRAVPRESHIELN